MKSQREGSNLKTQIRMHLSILGRDPKSINLKRKKLIELRRLNYDLYKEVKNEQAHRDKNNCF